jgi:aryl-alcohol dehydrogenase-like predicted oxidoreductase
MIPREPFGRTGHESTRVIFGGWALSEGTLAEADRTLDLLDQYSINHIDVAPMYGKAEELVGPWLIHDRGRFFIATKTRSRTREAAWEDLKRSLDRLRTDAIDLWQLHGLTNPKGAAAALGPGGAIEALVEAREQGLVRYLGVTGHTPEAAAMHCRTLDAFEFDAVMLSYNYAFAQTARYAERFAELARSCDERGVALQTIKAVARRPWAGRSKTYHTYFYEPLAAQSAIDTAVHWVLGHPRAFLVAVGDLRILPKVLKAASRFEVRPSDDAMRTLVEEYDVQPIFGS